MIIGKNKILFMAVFFSITLFLANVSAIIINEVKIEPASVSPGEIATVRIEIENNLDEDITNLNVALDLSSNELPIAPFESSSEQEIEELEEDDEEFFNFKLIILPDAKSGIYKIPIRIAYFIQNQKQESKSFIGIIVNSEPQLTIGSDNYLVEGISREIIVRIVNNGLSDIKFLSIEADHLSNAIVNPPLYRYLGNIDSDDSDTFELTIIPDANSKSVKLPLIIKYKDSTNKDFIRAEILTIPVYTRDNAIRRGIIQESRLGVYLSIVVALILLYILYRIIKSGRKKAKLLQK